MLTEFIFAVLPALLASTVECNIEFSKSSYFDLNSEGRYYIDMTEDYFKNKSYYSISTEGKNSEAAFKTDSIKSPYAEDQKHSLSTMFWPMGENPYNSTSKCSFQLGLQGVQPPSEVIEDDFELVSSMLYFENIRIKDQDGLKNHFFAVNLDKTSHSNTLLRVYKGAVPEKWKEEFTCDSILYVRSDLSYIFCWRLLTQDIQNVTQYKLQIQARTWCPRVGDENTTNIFSIKLSQEQYNAISNVSVGFKRMKTIACKSFDGNSVDIAFYMRSMSFFFIIQLRGKEFTRYIYPSQYQTSDEEMPLWELKTPQGNHTTIYKVDYVDEYRFLVTEMVSNFNELNSSTFGNMHYIDATIKQPYIFVGKGMIVAFNRGTDSDGTQYVSEVLLITDTVLVNTPEVYATINIQKRKYYKGYFYGDQIFKLNITGNPRYFKGFGGLKYWVYVDYKKVKVEAGKDCEGQREVYARVRIAQMEKPHIVRTIKTFELNMMSPVKILQPSTNNILWVRYPHKVEVIELQDIGIDLHSSLVAQDVKNMISSKDAVNHTYRIVTSDVNDTNVILQRMRDVFKGRFLQFRKVNNSMVNEITASSIQQPALFDSNVWLNLTTNSRQFIYSTPLDWISIGNYISMKADPSNKYAKMEPFEKIKFYLSVKEGLRISKLFALQYTNIRYMLVCFENEKGNLLYKFNPNGNLNEPPKLVMTLYDSRSIDTLQELSSSKYLAHIEGLLYELDIAGLKLTPVFKANDICGRVSAKIHHSELGSLTICGGRDEITMFITDPRRKKIDLSTPLNNVRLSPTLFHSLKSNKIHSIFSTPSFLNRFALLSAPVTIIPGAEPPFVSKIKLQLYEVCSSKQFVDVVAEYETWIYFKETLQDIQGYIVEDRLLLFIVFKVNGVTKESAHIYQITTSFSLIFDKKIDFPQNFRLNMQNNRPLMTYLPVKKTLMSTIYGPKIVLMFSLLISKDDILQNFDFFDFSNSDMQVRTKNILAVLDVKQTSLNFLKILEMPGNVNVFSFGPFYVNDENEQDALGLIVAGEDSKKNTFIQFFSDHSLSVDLYSYASLENYFNEPMPDVINYNFSLVSFVNHQTKNISVTIHIKTNNSAQRQLSIKQPKFNLNLLEQDGAPKRYPLFLNNENSTRRDLINGYSRDFQFVYDSWIEKQAGKIEGNFHFKLEMIPSSVKKMFENMISYKISFKTNENAFDIPPIDRFYKAGPSDYIDLMYASSDITHPKFKMASKSVDIQPNYYLSNKYRCTKFFYQSSPTGAIDELVGCLELDVDLKNKKSSKLLIYIFNERPGPDNIYGLDKPEKPVMDFLIDFEKTPFNDVSLSSTLNHLVLKMKNSNTEITYSYTVFRVRMEGGKHAIKQVYTEDVWLMDFSFTSNFYEETIGTNKVATERFCSVSMNNVEGIKLFYYCFAYDPAKPDEFKPQSKNVQIFNYFKYEDLERYPPDIHIYTPVRNPAAVDNYLVKDPNLYLSINFKSYHTIFAKIDPYKTGTEADIIGTMSFAFLCNPFEGYKFKMEAGSMSERLYVKVFSTDKKSYITFYSLPPEYTDDMRNFDLFYTIKQIQEATPDKRLTCIESKYTKELDFPVKKLYKLKFNNKPAKGSEDLLKDQPNDLLSVNTAATVKGTPLVYLRKAIQFVLRTTGDNFYRVEYHPSILVRTRSTLLLSDTLLVNVKGMYNSNITMYISIVSGKVTDIWFMVKYILPLIVLVLLLFLLNYAMNYLFQRFEITKESDIDKPFEPKDLLKNNVISTLLDDGNKDRESNPTVKLDLAEETVREKEIIAANKANRLKREALGMPLILVDAEYAQEMQEADYIYKLYKEGVLELEPEVINELKEKEGDEEIADLARLVSAKECGIEVSEQEQKDLEEFEEYMQKKKEEELEKAKEAAKRKTKFKLGKGRRKRGSGSEEEDDEEQKKLALNKLKKKGSDSEDSESKEEEPKPPQPRISNMPNLAANLPGGLPMPSRRRR